MLTYRQLRSLASTQEQFQSEAEPTILVNDFEMCTFTTTSS